MDGIKRGELCNVPVTTLSDEDVENFPEQNENKSRISCSKQDVKILTNTNPNVPPSERLDERNVVVLSDVDSFESDKKPKHVMFAPSRDLASSMIAPFVRQADIIYGGCGSFPQSVYQAFMEVFNKTKQPMLTGTELGLHEVLQKDKLKFEQKTGCKLYYGYFTSPGDLQAYFALKLNKTLGNDFKNEDIQDLNEYLGCLDDGQFGMLRHYPGTRLVASRNGIRASIPTKEGDVSHFFKWDDMEILPVLNGREIDYYGNYINIRMRCKEDLENTPFCWVSIQVIVDRSYLPQSWKFPSAAALKEINREISLT